jgi:glutathione S-transferase
MARRSRGESDGALDQRRDACGLPGVAPGVPDEYPFDINRVMAIWRQCRNRHGEGNGDFLFGSFTIADAMYAPVVTRFRTYKFDLEREADAYCDAITAMPAMQEWAAAANNEPMVIDQYEF